MTTRQASAKAKAPSTRLCGDQRFLAAGLLAFLGGHETKTEFADAK